MDKPISQTIHIDDVEYEFLVLVGPIEENFLRIEYDNIDYIDIENDIENGIPKIQLQVTDINFETISNVEANGQTLLNISMTRPDVKIERGRTLVETFVIDDIQLVEAKSNQATYLITGTHIDGQAMADYMDFSATNENPIDIIMKILKKSNLKVVNEQQLPNVKCNHISGPRDSVSEQCSYLCDMASSTKDGSYFLVYNFFLSKWTIVSTNTIPIDIDKIDENTTYQTDDVESFIIPTEKNTGDKASIVTELKQLKLRDKSTSGIPAYTVMNYDNIKRKWNVNKITNKLFKTNINQSGKYLKSVLVDEDPSEERTIYLPTMAGIGSTARNLVLYTDAVTFNVMGNLRKEVGSFIALETSSVGLDKKFGGVWMIAKINHNISKAGYRCDIVAVRSVNLKYEKNERVT